MFFQLPHNSRSKMAVFPISPSNWVMQFSEKQSKLMGLTYRTFAGVPQTSMALRKTNPAGHHITILCLCVFQSSLLTYFFCIQKHNTVLMCFILALRFWPICKLKWRLGSRAWMDFRHLSTCKLKNSTNNLPRSVDVEVARRRKNMLYKSKLHHVLV